MWFGCHRPPANGGAGVWPGAVHFDIFHAISSDGRRWAVDEGLQPAFPATRDRNLFDGRFVSTPCVVAVPLSVDDTDLRVRSELRRLLFYSARDCGQLYASSDGTLRFDSAGIYRHIGVAVSTQSCISLGGNLLG